MLNLFSEAQKIQEAYAVLNGLPVKRRFSDTELADSRQRIREAHGVESVAVFLPCGSVVDKSLSEFLEGKQ